MSLFKGEITADAVTARVSAGTGPLRRRRQHERDDGREPPRRGPAGHRRQGRGRRLGPADRRRVGASTRPRPAGTKGYKTAVTELDLKLTADHGGLPAGSEIQIGDGDRRGPDGAARDDDHHDHDDDRHHLGGPDEGPSVGDAPNLRPRSGGKTKPQPLKVQPKLTAGRYVFPVYGPTSYIDTFGAKRADVTYHHGDDIFGSLGQPLVACTDGIVFSVGFNKIGGNRLWIVDKAGQPVLLRAPLRVRAQRRERRRTCKAGQVIGFMGNTGDAEGTPYHLHFEIHPVSFLYLGYDGAVDPTPVPRRVAAPAGPAVPDRGRLGPPIPAFGSAAPEPGAILLGMHDISTADGLDPGSLEAALAPVDRSSLMQTLVPTARWRRPATSGRRRTSDAAVRGRGSRRRSRRRRPTACPSRSGASPGR